MISVLTLLLSIESLLRLKDPPPCDPIMSSPSLILIPSSSFWIVLTVILSSLPFIHFTSRVFPTRGISW